MTASKDVAVDKCCSANCSLCMDTITHGIYACGNPDSDHQAHLFTDEHPICADVIWRKQQ